MNHSPPALFFFFKVEISLRTPVPLFRPGAVQSGGPSKLTVAKHSLTSSM